MAGAKQGLHSRRLRVGSGAIFATQPREKEKGGSGRNGRAACTTPNYYKMEKGHTALFSLPFPPAKIMRMQPRLPPLARSVRCEESCGENERIEKRPKRVEERERWKLDKCVVTLISKFFFGNAYSTFLKGGGLHTIRPIRAQRLNGARKRWR